MFRKYEAWIAARNARIIANLPPPSKQYYDLIKASGAEATTKYNLVPIRCMATFLKMHGRFTIRQYKGDWR